MYIFLVTKVGVDHKEFWRLSWYEVGLYVRRFEFQMDLEKERELNNWRRFRIQWCDFRNVHRSKKKRPVYPSDLIKLPEDERPAKYHEIDLDAVKQKFGSKIKKRGK